MQELFEELVVAEIGPGTVRCSIGTCCSYVHHGMVITNDEEEWKK